MSAVTAMQAAGHDKPYGTGSIVPTLAKNARTGHPQFRNGKETARRKGGPPAVEVVKATVSQQVVQGATGAVVGGIAERAVTTGDANKAMNGTQWPLTPLWAACRRAAVPS
jgi:hypothetical protein